MGSPKVTVVLGFQLKLKALLDTGAEVNVMTRRVMEEAGLAMRKGPSLKLISHNGASTTFVGVCENVEVEVGSLVTTHPIFVVQDAAHALILGQPFLLKTRFTQSFENGKVWGTVCDEDQRCSVVFKTLEVEKSAHRSRNDLFSLN